jgi:hypothetical protein
MMSKLKNLHKRLYPKGRAFNVKNGSNHDKLITAITESEQRVVDSAKSILFSILPDNQNFTVEDAEKWEQRLGMISNPNVSLEDRKLAIARKLNHPGNIPARQSRNYVEQSLRDAGFDVYVYENPDRLSPADLIGAENTGIAEHDADVEHQETGMEHGNGFEGSIYSDMIANWISEDNDNYFNVGDDLRRIFYVCGDPLGTFANVDADRKDEFRQLILRLKPSRSVGVLFINYI